MGTSIRAKPRRRSRRESRKIVASHAKAAADALRDAPEEPDEELPPLPDAPTRGNAEVGSEPPEAFKALGLPPSDELAAQSWLHRMVMLCAYDAANDKTLSPRERRREIRQNATSAAGLLPDARKYAAEQIIKSDRAELEARVRAKQGAKLESMPPAAGDVIPFDAKPY